MKKAFLKLPMGLRMTLIAMLYIVILVTHIGIVYLYNNNVATVIDTKQVVVAVRDIPIHNVITIDDVEIKPVKLDNIVTGAYESLESVIGKEAQVKIVANDQLHESKISEKVKEEGEIIIELPQEWIVSYPKSTRRFDLINVIPIEDKDKKASLVSMNLENPEVLKEEEERKAKAEKLLAVSKEKLSGISVVYFKDNTANDITDDSPNVTYEADAPRVTASNMGTRIEVAITPEQWEIIQGLYEVNYKFVVGYQ